MNASSWSLGLALVTLAVYVWMGLALARGNRALARLAQIEPLPPTAPHPRVSVIIPARNEEATIARALRAVLAQDYPDYEVLVLNDRSIDGTGRVLEAAAREQSRLRVIHISALPDGWLGKNHALCEGAKQATGQILLFADADVVMAPSTLSRAVSHLTTHRLDHLTAVPHVLTPGLWLELFVGAFSIFFALFYQTWKARDPKSPRYVGIGAFNMVRGEVYRAIGTHRAIALRPDDDMMLAKLIKRARFHADVLLGMEMIEVQWYASLGDLVRGLEKNAFAGLNYEIPAVIASLLLQLSLQVWPFIAVLVTSGPVRWVNALVVAVVIAMCADNARFHGLRPWIGVTFPAASLIMSWILVRSTVVTLVSGGITWRGTHYPLDALRANQV